jgi:uncharacterized protein
MKHKTGIEEIIKEKIEEISSICSKGATVAFSGGLDSSVALRLAIDALGREKVQALMVSFGSHSYSTAIEGARKFVKSIDFNLSIYEEIGIQDKIWKNGPSCNACTRNAKLPTVEKYAKFPTIITGSNLSDSWGTYGLKINGRFYSPLMDLDKRIINDILDYYGLKVYRAGENIHREGCKLKHLLKMNANPDFHGKAVDLSNEKLIGILRHHSIKTEIANVKIIGPLSKNIALINVFPDLDETLKSEIIDEISKIDAIDETYFVDSPILLTVMANPGLFNNKNSLKWVERGRIQPEFVRPIKFRWLKSKNKKLNTFSVVAFEKLL